MTESIELSVVRIVVCLFTTFFWGMSIDRKEESRKIAKKIFHVLLAIVWVCNFFSAIVWACNLIR